MEPALRNIRRSRRAYTEVMTSLGADMAARLPPPPPLPPPLPRYDEHRIRNTALADRNYRVLDGETLDLQDCCAEDCTFFVARGGRLRIHASRLSRCRVESEPDALELTVTHCGFHSTELVCRNGLVLIDSCDCRDSYIEVCRNPETTDDIRITHNLMVGSPATAASGRALLTLAAAEWQVANNVYTNTV